MAFRSRIGPQAITVMAILLLSGLAGGIYAMRPGDSRSAGDERSSGGVPVTDDASLKAALAAAESRAGFPAKVPAMLPTSASRLVWVDSSKGPSGNGLGLIELIYQGDETVTIDGVELAPTVEIFLVDAVLREPNGERLALDAGPFTLYKEIVSLDQAGNPTKVGYTAVGREGTITITFTGDPPTDAGVVQMLNSFRALE